MKYLNDLHSILDDIVEYAVIADPQPKGRFLLARKRLIVARLVRSGSARRCRWIASRIATASRRLIRLSRRTASALKTILNMESLFYMRAQRGAASAERHSTHSERGLRPLEPERQSVQSRGAHPDDNSGKRLRPGIRPNGVRLRSSTRTKISVRCPARPPRIAAWSYFSCPDGASIPALGGRRGGAVALGVGRPARPNSPPLTRYVEPTKA